LIAKLIGLFLVECKKQKFVKNRKALSQTPGLPKKEKKE
jgi:hypothetical protein